MPQRIVDILEPVQIHAEEGKQSVPRGRSSILGKPFFHSGPVIQLRQEVPLGLIDQFSLALPPFRDVRQVTKSQQIPGGRIFQQVNGGGHPDEGVAAQRAVFQRRFPLPRRVQLQQGFRGIETQDALLIFGVYGHLHSLTEPCGG